MIRSAESLARAVAILDALDHDEAGIKAGKWWREQYPQSSRWPVPQGKDAGEAFAAGVSLRTWILAGLPPVFHEHPPIESARRGKEMPGPAEVAPAANGHGSQAAEETAAVAGTEAFPHEGNVPANDVLELKKLLEEAGGFFRIYDQGYSLGPVVPLEWSTENRAKRRRIAELLFFSEAVGHLIENLADGLYGPENILT